MTYSDLLSLIKRLRTAQKTFFRTRDYKALEESKKLEKQIDKLIEEDEKGPDLFQ